MFRWRKRNEGFEWRDYVRTTILVRREQRRQRIKDVQAAAAAQVKDVGHRGLDAGIRGARAAGSGGWSLLKSSAETGGSLAARASRMLLAGGEALLRGALTAGRTALSAAASLAAAAAATFGRAATPLGPVVEPILSYAREPRPNLVLKIAAVAAGLGAVYRTWSFGFDTDAAVAAFTSAAAAIVVALAYLTDPYRNRHGSRRESLLSRLRERDVPLPGNRSVSLATASLAVLALLSVAAAGTWLYGSIDGSPKVASTRVTTTASLQDASRSADLVGRAQAVTGDRLKVAGTLVALDGIEAPEIGQVCHRKSGTWRCGAAARDALAGYVRGRRTSCEIVSEDAGVKRARCTAGDNDLAEALVRNGLAFSTGGFLSRYSSLESEAESEQKGIWAGEAERPQDYRDKVWEEAKRTAPEGCPIKGRVRSGARTYVLPWSPSYESVKLSKARGERWFCSESEAQSAGWSPGAPS